VTQTRGGSGGGPDIIARLHRLSKELRQLQHLFESYKTLIKRIAAPRGAEPHAQGSSSVLHLSADVVLSPSARNRFERLADRLQLLMLNTIKEYLEEKSALSDTVRNPTPRRLTLRCPTNDFIPSTSTSPPRKTPALRPALPGAQRFWRS
jgi:murein endopeptidase